MNNVISLAKARNPATPATTLDLPFVGRRRRPRKNQFAKCYWHNVASTGDLRQDQALGRQYAYLALQAIKAEDFAPLLGWIVLDMIENKCPEHIAIGFFQTIADVALGIHQIPAADVRLSRSCTPNVCGAVQS